MNGKGYEGKARASTSPAGSSFMKMLTQAKSLSPTKLPSATTWGTRLALFALIVLLATGLSFADGTKHKLSNDLEAFLNSNGARVDVIIQFTQAPTAMQHANVRSKGGIPIAIKGE